MNGTVNRDLYLSFSLSLALHVAALVALALWTVTQVARDLSGSAPVVSVSVAPAEADAPATASDAPAPGDPAPARPQPAAAPTEPLPEGLTAAPPPAPRPALADAPTPPAETEVPERAADPAPTPARAARQSDAPAPPATDAATENAVQSAPPLVAAHTPDEAVVAVAVATPPAPAAVPMSTKQEKMLAKKLAAWSANLHKMDLRDSTATWEYKDQTYTAEFVRQSVDDTGLDEIVVRVSTDTGGQTLSTEMRLRRLAFSSFAQFVNRWDPNVQIHDDELDGRFHSNSEITLGYSRAARPIFHGKVTTASRAVNIARKGGRVGRSELFRGGLETGVKRINLPKRFVPGADTLAARATEHFEKDTRIVFHEDGTYTHGPADGTGAAQRRDLGDSGGVLIAAPKARLFVRGTIKGNVLVYSPDDIVIEGDLVYAHDPQLDPQGENFLGLVSDRSVVVAHPDVTGPGDLHVHGSIYAKRRFAVTRYRVRNEGTLHVFGSVSAGSVTATEPRYATKIRFDPRLETRRAPGFPLTDRYETTTWDRTWRADSP